MITAPCSICGEAKPASEFYADSNRTSGLSSRCKGCDNGRRRQTPARILRNRARQRATQQIVAEHAERFRELYEHALEMVKDEAELLAQQPEAHDHGTVRLRPGRYAEGDDVLDRIDVGRCAACVDAHSTGHICPDCGASPDDKRDGTERLDRGAFLEDVEWIMAGGETDAVVIAQRVGMSRDAMLKRLYRYERNDLVDRMDHTGREAGVA